MTPDDLKADRAALERAIAQRQRQIDDAKTLAWCEARNDARGAAETVATKSAPSTRRDNQAMNDTAGWQRYIAGEINRSEMHVIKLLAETTGQVLGELQKKLRGEFKAQLEAEVLKLRNEFLQSELDRERGVKRPSVVPFDKSAQIA